MFLYEIGSSDPRFKRLEFHAGMNILLADKTSHSTSGNSRNGAGKTSFVRILRYLFGGRVRDCLKAKPLQRHSFWAKVELQPDEKPCRVRRPISPQNKVYLDESEISLNEWKEKLSVLFGLSMSSDVPKVGQLFAQIIRDFFADPLKTFAAEPGWESGARIGFFLGFSPEILVKAREISQLEKGQKLLKQVLVEGDLGGTQLSEPELRSKLAGTKEKRSQLASDLSGFRVDDQYAEHQAEADRLTHEIRNLNDESLLRESRKRDLKLAMAEEESTVPKASDAKQVEDMFMEVGIVLPDTVTRRFHEVQDFHTSVVRNRQIFLEKELMEVEERLAEIQKLRTALDSRRATVMNLLEETMALDTFRCAEKELSELDALVADLENKLENIKSVSDGGIRLRALASQAEASLRGEIADRAQLLEDAIVLFQKLGEEIYNDRQVSLLIEATTKGTLKVVPKIDGDASAGILGVKTFLLDLVCAVIAIRLGRAPRILVHDSQLFDSMDDRQVASCLKIGARLAEDVGFQYIVTLNSDRLAAAEAEGFDRQDYVLDPVLKDRGDEGGLFGFRFV